MINENMHVTPQLSDGSLTSLNGSEIDNVSGGIIPALIIGSFAAGFIVGYYSAQ